MARAPLIATVERLRDREAAEPLGFRGGRPVLARVTQRDWESCNDEQIAAVLRRCQFVVDQSMGHPCPDILGRDLYFRGRAALWLPGRRGGLGLG